MQNVKSVDVAWLLEHNACQNQVDLFRETFGDSVKLSRKALLRAANVGLNLGWFA